MIKPRKNVSLDGKTHEQYRKLAFKRKTTITDLIREGYLLLQYPAYKHEDGKVTKP